MLHHSIPCPSGVRAKKRGASTLGNFHGNQTKRCRIFHKEAVTVCVREGNRAVPALRMYKNRNEGK